MTPKNTPKKTQLDIGYLLTKNNVAYENKVILVGVRGYYRDSMGAKFKNDRGIYDDAVFILTPTLFAAYNFNTDPSAYRKGKGFGSAKGMATLKTGIWKYQKGIHRGYQAFVQAGKVTVIRDGSPNYEDTGYFGINIHRGGNSGTSSLGCQTLPVSQWDVFKKSLYYQLDYYKQKTFEYFLIDEASTGWND